MDSKGKFTKNVVRQDWGIASDESIEVRRNIPKDILTILDRQYKDHQYPTTTAYCNGYISYVEKHVEGDSPPPNGRVYSTDGSVHRSS